MTGSVLATRTVARGEADEGIAWCGREQGPEPVPTHVDAVQVRQFAALVRDADPRWWRDADPAPVPPALLMSYALPLPWYPDERDARPLWARIPLPGDTLINVSTTTTFHQPLTTATRLQMVERVAAVSPPKRTRVGTGQFVTTTTEYSAGGRPVASHENVMLRYQRGGRGGAVPEPAAPDPPRGAVATTLEVTLELCVLDVSATQDFFPGHYDPAYAQAQGVRGVFLNTIFFHGLVDQLARRAVGGGWEVARRHLVMRASACVGDLLTGWACPPVTSSDPARSIVEVVVRTDQGLCADARVELAPVG